MGTRTSRLGVSWVVSVALSSFGIRAASPQIVESVKDRDAAALRAALKQGADVNTLQPDGATALHWAAHWNDLEAADLLIRAGARVNVANAAGETALHGAAYRGNDLAVQFLVDKGAAVNPKNKNGRTPLDVAEGEYFQATFQIHQSTAGLLRKLGGTGSPRARQDLVTPVK